MKKRSCKRFNIPGTALYYRGKPFFFFNSKFSNDYYPVINLSKGGARFLCHQRLAPGRDIIIKLKIPGVERVPEILASIKWISKNHEQSYQYQTGIAFNAYGGKKNENSMDVLSLFEELEARSED